MNDAPDLFSHDEPGPRFKATDIATAIARGGVPFPTAQARVANFAKAGLIYSRGKAANAAKNSPALYSMSDLAAATMLSAVIDCGVSDREILADASVALYSWAIGAAPRSVHPILTAAVDTWKDRAWCLQLRFHRNLETDQRRVNRSFGSMDSPAVWSSPELNEVPWVPIGELVISTAPLAALQRLVSVPKEAN